MNPGVRVCRAGSEPERSFRCKRLWRSVGPRKTSYGDDLRELFQGAIRLTLEMVLEEELKAMVGARRFERGGKPEGP